jgi:hypothetical protein
LQTPLHLTAIREARHDLQIFADPICNILQTKRRTLPMLPVTALRQSTRIA